MPVLIEKHARQNPDNGDGYRLLVTRFWLRGLKRENINLWFKDLAPSKELLREYTQFSNQQKPCTDQQEYHEEWSEKYCAEMLGQHELIYDLARRHINGDTLTLLCACHSTEHCHRTILAELIEDAAKVISTDT